MEKKEKKLEKIAHDIIDIMSNLSITEKVGTLGIVKFSVIYNALKTNGKSNND